VAERNRPHIVVTRPADAVPYRPHSRRVPKPRLPTPNREQHGTALTLSVVNAQREAQARRAAANEAGLALHAAVPGVYVQFESVPNVELKVESLEERRGKTPIEVVAFSEENRGTDERPLIIQRATVFVPDGAVKKFVQKFERYQATPSRALEPGAKRVQRHHDAFDRVAALRLATLKALWTDVPSLFPADGDVAWWEVWLRRSRRDEPARFRAFAREAGVFVSERALAFDDRAIVLARGTPEALSWSLEVLDVIAELRAARRLAAGIRELTNIEQGEYVEDLLARIDRRGGSRPAVCVLDTGVNRAHPLLARDLDVSDVHTVDRAWGTHDPNGHGTQMAGLALFGNLAPLILSNSRVTIDHCLESVKVLPNIGTNDPDLYGAITAEAVARPEIQAPTRQRVFSMAITAPDETDRGRPTSWSSAVDALAAGRSFDSQDEELVYLDDEPHPRLIVVSAGNVSVLQEDHLARSDVETIQDPAQAWNALTVGAHTDLAQLVETGWPNGRALAPAGELSPWSCTSLTFEKKWPLKPDVVFEGGNVVRMASGAVDFPAASLCLLTTGHNLPSSLFDLSWATSAASAQASRLAARIWATYPEFWPETVRALVVHSATWTRRMLQSVPPLRRTDMRRLLRRYGFGVPDEDRAIRSGRDALTLVHQGIIHPFRDGKLREMHVHALPWPKDALSQLAAATVLLRVTLSYFIEPNPSRRGRRSRYRYASHGLRFDLKRATESAAEFRKRINKKDLGEDEEKPDTSGDISEWKIGDTRNLGSLHSDFWEGSAVDLAEREVIAVYPVSGWWKDLPTRDRSDRGARYALVVSIETEAVGVDLWTPVAQQVGVLVDVSR
jgi:hypothetical protein